jgi:uncharacterized cupin superfamily protein
MEGCPVILRRDSVRAVHTGPTGRPGRVETIHLSDAGGLTQFGAFEQILYPGTHSSNRHWHSAEDEMLFVLDGVATVIDDQGAHELAPGDAAVWRAGVPDAHHVLNATDAPIRFLIIGTRIALDVCRYPDSGNRLTNTLTEWELTDRQGARLDGGALPPEYLGVSADWTSAPGSTGGAPRVVRKADARIERASQGRVAQFGYFEARLYSDTGGLAQFGAFTETLMPGSRSGERHWHEAEDEFLYVIAGHPTVVEEDGPHRLSPGDAAVWKAGVPNGHHVVNETDGETLCLIVGSRLPSDRVHYPEVDKLYVRENGAVRRTRRDGSPLPADPGVSA